MPASDIDIGGNHIGEKYPGALTTFYDDPDYQQDHDQEINYQYYKYRDDGDENCNFPKCRTQLFD